MGQSGSGMHVNKMGLLVDRLLVITGSIGGKILNATFESTLTARGMTIRRIRKLSTLIATAGQLTFASGFVVAPSAISATVSYCLMTLAGTFHYSGLEPNYVSPQTNVNNFPTPCFRRFLTTGCWRPGGRRREGRRAN